MDTAKTNPSGGSASQPAKPMTPKMFLHRSNGRISAEGFLAQHRAFLTTGELGEMASPVIRQLDENQILPTPALSVIRGIVLAHLLAVETRKAEESMARKAEGGQRTVKAWLATIYTEEGEIAQALNSDGDLEDLQKDFELSSQADGWVDRRLFDGAADWHGNVVHTTVTVGGDPFGWDVSRTDAIARILKRPRQAALKQQKKSAGKLSWGAKCSQSIAKFSRG